MNWLVLLFFVLLKLPYILPSLPCYFVLFKYVGPPTAPLARVRVDMDVAIYLVGSRCCQCSVDALRAARLSVCLPALILYSLTPCIL